MTTAQLGALEDLPREYRDALAQKNLAPLWPNLRNFLPYERPAAATRPTSWRYDDIRPLLLRAGTLTPIEKAERRVLVLCNPGLGIENAMATPSIYLGLQLILPGEHAPNHKHSPSAIRFVVEGEGAYTVVRGEKLPMEPGDLILTPSGLWHEHGHRGEGPVIWLDALDLPLLYRLEASYCTESSDQIVNDGPDQSQTHYRRSGLVPYEVLDRAPGAYPLTRYPWADVKAALNDLASTKEPGKPIHIAYVNPETGDSCLPTLGFSAMMIRAGESVKLPRRSCSLILHAIEGSGSAQIDDASLDWDVHDTLAAPTHASIEITNRSSRQPAYLFIVDDAPLQRKLGFYEILET